MKFNIKWQKGNRKPRELLLPGQKDQGVWQELSRTLADSSDILT